ncbi:MAG TPA: hypothetical protein VKQ08_08095 [Cyclobacteriaceae bacterium]|nr:hypothetical protein [Cyclobacteriaceae bacterium]
MKLQKIVFFSLLLSASVVGVGQSPEQVTIQTDLGYGIFNVIYKTKATMPGTVHVSILNDLGKVIFTEAIYKTRSFSRPYNFNDIGMGEFKLLVEDSEGKIEKKISFTSPQKKGVESDIQVVKIGNSPNKYILAIANNEPDEIHVKILGADKEVLHDESIAVSGKYSVIFNLTHIKTSPTFEVTGSNGVLKTFEF